MAAAPSGPCEGGDVRREGVVDVLGGAQKLEVGAREVEQAGVEDAVVHGVGGEYHRLTGGQRVLPTRAGELPHLSRPESPRIHSVLGIGTRVIREIEVELRKALG